MFRILISDTKNKKKGILVEKTFKISKVKEIIKILYPTKGDIDLIYNGILLNDDETIEDCEIHPDSCICFVGAFKAGNKLTTDILNEKDLIVEKKQKN